MTNVSLHRFSRLPRQFLVALGLGLGILTVGAIAPPPSPTQDTAPKRTLPAATLDSNQADTSTVVQDDPLSAGLDGPESSEEIDAAASPPRQTVQLYLPTENCDGFRTEEREITPPKAISQVVHFLFSEQATQLPGFELAGYRIQSAAKGNTVTIDFRRAPDAQRQFISLSICEQRVLFGSLKKTLEENPTLNVDTVRFTERGRPIQM